MNWVNNGMAIFVILIYGWATLSTIGMGIRYWAWPRDCKIEDDMKLIAVLMIVGGIFHFVLFLASKA